MTNPPAASAPARPDYGDLDQQLAALLGGESDPVANAANTAALIFHQVPGLNWAGVYFAQPDGSLLLGPFQGKPACVRIGPGQGVCGAAAARRATVRVDDVHAFPGHIACDAASRSELVIPLLDGGRLLGVLDLDSPLPARFDALDQAGLERLAHRYVAASAARSAGG
jgi:GAF domain-containing protein